MALGIIAGSGNLPKIIAEAAAGNQKLAIICLEDYACPENFSNLGPVVILKLGQVGKAIDFFKKHEVNKIVMAGAVKRPSLTAIIPDMIGAKLLALLIRTKLLGDDYLLKCVADFFEKYGFEIISPEAIMPQTINTAGVLTCHIPTGEQLEDIKIGITAAKTLGNLDIGQSVIIAEKRVIAVEAAEGTEELIKRTKYYIPKAGAVLIKAAKPNQDLRLDLPTIGTDTIDQMAGNNLKGIAIEQNKVILLDLKETIAKAEKLGIFIYVF